MNLNKLQEKLEDYRNRHAEDYVRAVEAFDDGLMKTHEVVSFVHWKINDLFEAAEHGVMKVSNTIGEHLEKYIDDHTSEPQGEVVAEYENVAGNKEKTVATMTHQDKVEYILEGYGIIHTEEQIAALHQTPEGTLNYAVEIIKARRRGGSAREV